MFVLSPAVPSAEWVSVLSQRFLRGTISPRKKYDYLIKEQPFIHGCSSFFVFCI